MGTVSAELRRKVLRNFASYVIGVGPGFGKRVGDRIEVTELVCCLQSLEAMAVCEIVVEEDMLSLAEGVLHPGCSAYLIDMVTALPFIIIGLAKDEQRSTSNSYPSKFAMAPFSPSQRLDITFHDAATLYVLLVHGFYKVSILIDDRGARLKIIGKSTTHSGSSLIVRCEIWDTGEERLVASAMHCKVMPSKKPPSATLIKL